MRITDVLRGKGTQVVTVPPDTKVRRLLDVLAEHRIGAVVVSADGTSVGGIVSERDIVGAFAKRGAAVMSEPVTDIYTADVHTITPDISLERGPAHDDRAPDPARAGRGRRHLARDRRASATWSRTASTSLRPNGPT